MFKNYNNNNKKASFCPLLSQTFPEGRCPLLTLCGAVFWIAAATGLELLVIQNPKESLMPFSRMLPVLTRSHCGDSLSLVQLMRLNQKDMESAESSQAAWGLWNTLQGPVRVTYASRAVFLPPFPVPWKHLSGKWDVALSSCRGSEGPALTVFLSCFTLSVHFLTNGNDLTSLIPSCSSRIQALV